ncbi:hypothetical protein G4B88_015301 [Cannabis sativa]|uniref:Cytochrome P450 n=1 Tax=Cannabis sativa TaxID=3483 RepID=A0A7J6EDD0_CANSA|nr:hypothetical protein G4B88_015301 [Cannabis sativa]
MEMLNVVIGVLVGGFVLLFLYLYNSFVLEPIRLRSKLQKQGIGGPLPSFLLGNISEMKKIKLELSSKRTTTTCNTNDKLYDVVSIGHDWPSTIFPHLIQWRVDHGPIFSYAVGNIQFLCITDIELVKEVSLCTSLSLGKPSYLSKNHGPLFGQGIISSSGQIWAHQKKIIAPELYIDKVKGMVELMVNSTNSLIRSWEKKIEDEGGVSDIKVDDDLRSLSADIISKACFGSSYSQGEQIFSKLRTLQKLMSKRTIGIPGIRFIPTMNNIHVWRLEKQINAMILEVVKQRTEAADEKDLLQMIVEGAKACGGIDSPSVGLTHDKFIVDNCKSIYFAGHETTATTASWALLLLAAYPAWQTRVRAEVEEVWKNGSPHANMLRSMKVLTMVIQETLRLYPPGVYVVRNALQDVQFKDILVPKGINIQIPISMMQQDTNLWGPDAQQFNPGRFEHGILGASKFPQAYMPFGIGTRICIGQHMAMTELKVVLSLILSKFCFSVSPAYRHSAAFRLVIESEHGVNLQITQSCDYVMSNVVDVLKPKRLRLKLQKQGIRGPLPSNLLGNVSELNKIKLQFNSKRTNTNDKLHDVVSIGHDWPSNYLNENIYAGPIFLYGVGNTQFLFVTDIDMVKEVSLISTSLNLGRPPYLSRNYGPLFGQGIISSSGQIWAHQKKILAPEFYNDKVKVVKQRTEAADEKDLVQMIFEGAKAYGGIDSPSLGITRDRKNAL